LNRSSELWIRPGTDAGAARRSDALPALVYRADSAVASLILAHGAGAGQHSAFMARIAAEIAGLGVDVITFDFPYVVAKRRIPDRAPVLEAAYRAAIETVAREIESARAGLFIGGKSMGGRIATQVAAADRPLPIAGLVLLGYPLHPPGRPDRLRAAHLPAIGRPMLFVQGSRDSFGTPHELAPILAALVPPPTLHVVDGGDHSFKLARRDAKLQATAYDDVLKIVGRWIRATLAAR
jgi:predicted alpha/beta-hydrolase family hydrolase